MKTIESNNFPKQRDLRIDVKSNMYNTKHTRLLIDTTDETVIYVLEFLDKTLTDAYQSLKFLIRNDMVIDTFFPNYCGDLMFKKFTGVNYK